MRGAVVADEPCAVHREHDVQALEADVVDDLVVAALEEGRVDRGHWLGSLERKPRGELLREGETVALLGYGYGVSVALGAADRLAEEHGVEATVADARFAKPLDHELILQMARHHQVVITIEEGATGGFGAHVLHFLAGSGRLDRGLCIRTMTLPDRFLDQDTPRAMYEAAGLHARHIVDTALAALGMEADSPPERALAVAAMA